jgi:SHS family lactate transporter-like MFS transporter
MVKLRNPYVILRELDRYQWLMFFSGFLGWTWDAFDFFTVSLTVTDIADDFGVSKADVSWVLFRFSRLLTQLTHDRES